MLVNELGLRPQPYPVALESDWFIPLNTSEKMHRASLRFQNCLRQHVARMIWGDALYFEALTDPPAVVQLTRMASGRWVAGEISGAFSHPVSHDTLQRIRDHLDAHDIELSRDDCS